MNKPYTDKKWLHATKLLLLSALLTGVLSCNKPFDNTLNNDGSEVPPSPVNRKTLLIVVDGAVGSEVEAVKPPTLNSLVDYSIFSWDGLTDFKNNNITNAYAWATLLTGTNSDKHNVTGNDFTGNDLATYPSIFTRLKQERPQLRTAAFCSSPEVADNLAADATETQSFAEDDAAVKEAVIAELSSKDPSLLLAQFHDVDKAGAAGSYAASSPDYKDAILRVDSYIGDILTAMRNRPGFQDENWMVIITSNKGSNTAFVPPSGALWNAFNDTRHNTFFFCFNPRFSSQNPAKPSTIIPYVGTTPLYDGNNAGSRARVLNPVSSLDMGASGGFTIQCKVKIPSGGYYYPAILGKRASFDGGVVGWVFFLEGDIWQINLSQVGNGNKQVAGGTIADGAWHTLTAVIRQEGAARNVYTYTDGVPGSGKTDIAAWGNMDSPSPLTVGYIPGSRSGGAYSPNNYRITDIRIYNTDLPGDYIAGNYCKTDVDSNDPYKNNLLGFWPATNVTADKKMNDLSGHGNDFLVDSYNPGSFNDISSNVCPTISEENYKTVPNSVDVAFQIFQWLGVTAPPSWQLDGKSWIPAYSDIGG
ncbi:MAG: DUF4983 domain-containing protein [Flavisolibacter sp.]